MVNMIYHYLFSSNMIDCKTLLLQKILIPNTLFLYLVIVNLFDTATLFPP